MALRAKKLDVFISHASKDNVVAKRIERVLEEDGLEVWLDRSEIRLGVLLRKELQDAIAASRMMILLWSETAAKSRWVAAEVLTAYHLDRFITACVRDGTALPYFLQNTIYLDLGPRKTGWIEPLRKRVHQAPKKANEIPIMMSARSPELEVAIRDAALAQYEVTARLGDRDVRGANAKQRAAGVLTVKAVKKWPLEPAVLNLNGYWYKNAYLINHWDAVQAGRPPKDELLERSQRCFFEALFVNPNDYEALNGLGSNLILERDLEAAAFFIGRAIALAEKNGVDYTAAKHDLEMIRAYLPG